MVVFVGFIVVVVSLAGVIVTLAVMVVGLALIYNIYMLDKSFKYRLITREVEKLNIVIIIVIINLRIG